MNTIDHVILIPAPPQIVWGIVSEIYNNPRWQADCLNVTFLTSHRSGPRARWRYADSSGREKVAEVTAWYQGLGYEYTLVDGVSFKENRGRIRLQEVPEGTYVQWTFSYETSGIFGGLRNRKKAISNTITENLRRLYRLILDQASTGEIIHEAKSLMRDAPDVLERSAYQPRHPSAIDLKAGPAAPSSGAQAKTPYPLHIDEPPISDEDTQPRPAVAVGQSAPLREPDFLSNISQDSAVASPTAPPAAEFAHKDEEIHLGDMLQGLVPSGSQAETPARPTQPSILSEPVPELDDIDIGLATRELTRIDFDRYEKEQQELALSDTSKISVFELFGLPKPSETQEMRAVVIDTLSSSPEASLKTSQEITAARPYRIGLRMNKRRGLYRLRRP